jgi:predicted nucleic acid-binding protein
VILTDTNILLRSIHPQHPHYAWAKSAVNTLRGRNEVLCVAPQNLVEFWAVATRPQGSLNGLGMTTEAARQALTAIKDLFPLLPEPVGMTRRCCKTLPRTAKP